MRVHVIVVGYSRPKQLSNLLEDLARERQPWVEISIYDDCSSCSMDGPARLCAEYGFAWTQLPTHHGKQKFWRL
jgi:hypothetical protein